MPYRGDFALHHDEDDVGLGEVEVEQYGVGVDGGGDHRLGAAATGDGHDGLDHRPGTVAGVGFGVDKQDPQSSARVTGAASGPPDGCDRGGDRQLEVFGEGDEDTTVEPSRAGVPRSTSRLQKPKDRWREGGR